MDIRLWGCAAACALVAVAPATAQTISSDFAASTDGWTHAAAAEFRHEATGGHPGGYLYIDNGEGNITYIFAPAAFLGDLSSYIGGTLSFDGNMIGVGGSPYTAPGVDYGHVRISGSGMTATLDLLPAPGQPSAGQWNTYTATLTAASWGKSEADWATLMANVTQVRLSVEAMFGNEVQAIDNVTIAAIPEPRSYALMLAGLALVGAVLRRRR